MKCCGPLRRARRFNRSDPFFGNLYDPLSLHKYAYGQLDPVAFLDPTGLSGVPGTVYQAVGTKVHWMFSIFVYGMGWSSKPGATLGVLLPDLFPPTDPQHLLKPDLTDTRYKKYLKLKPVTWANDSGTQLSELLPQLQSYDVALQPHGYDRGRRGVSRSILTECRWGLFDMRESDTW